ncbi:hypothetical protein RJ639_028015 [Escallonia herrerae]|uniref:Uncharacterized protein n=1 Tax=Escallonia herrerae TaxID=1293975 RepID=A0AA89BFT1_9ASTE|nr:hypothetical protein RJ639_028015 [Escallonia herrerae]
MLYQYVCGANANSSGLMITAPILTTMAQATLGSDYTMRLSCHKNMRGLLHSPTLNSICIWTRFAMDDNFSKEKEALVNSLDKILDGKNAVFGDKSYYEISQYNASSHLSG